VLPTFGFIKYDNDKTVFFHIETGYLSGFHPEVGQLVAFDFGPAPDPSKPAVAVNIRVIKSAKAVQEENAIWKAVKTLNVGVK